MYKNIKKNFTFAVYLLVAQTAAFRSALAEKPSGAGLGSNNPEGVGEGIGFTLENPLGGTGDLTTLLSKFLDAMVTVGTPIIILAIIYSGFLFLFAQGNEDKIKTARKAFFYAVIGGVVLIGASAIAKIIQATVTQLGI